MPSITILVATRNRHKTAEIRAILGVECRSLADFPQAPALAEDADTFAGNAAQKATQLAQWLVEQHQAGSDALPMNPPGVAASRQSAAIMEAQSAALCRDAATPEFTGSTRKNSVHGILSPEARNLVLADDSGLEVDALNGAPGVYSARFAALGVGTLTNSSDAANNAKLLRLLEKVPLERRTARFRCALAVVEVQPRSPVGPPHLFEGACEGQIAFAPCGQGGFGYDPLFVPSGYRESFAELGESVKNALSHRAKALARLRQWLEPV